MTRDDVVRRVCIQHQVASIIDGGQPSATGDARVMLRALAEHVGDMGEIPVDFERSVTVTLAAYAQALIEALDREAAA